MWAIAATVLAVVALVRVPADVANQAVGVQDLEAAAQHALAGPAGPRGSLEDLSATVASKGPAAPIHHPGADGEDHSYEIIDLDDRLSTLEYRVDDICGSDVRTTPRRVQDVALVLALMLTSTPALMR